MRHSQLSVAKVKLRPVRPVATLVIDIPLTKLTCVDVVMQIGACGPFSCPANESGALSAWSFAHVLSGYAWNLSWSLVSKAVSGAVQLQTLNLWLLVLIGLVFELVENNPSSGASMWTWLGYTQQTYSGDSATNAITDMLFVLSGWSIVEVVVVFSSEAVVFVAIGGGALVLSCVFVVFFLEERRLMKRALQPDLQAGTKASLPAVLIR